MKVYDPAPALKSLTTSSKYICDAYGNIVYKGDEVAYISGGQIKVGIVVDIIITKAVYVPEKGYLDLKCYIKIEEIMDKQLTTLRRITTLVKK